MTNIEMAASRFPGYRISGNGKIAVVLNCAYKVVLVQTPLEACVLVAQPCKETDCFHGEHRWHKIVRLQRTETVKKTPVIWERE